MKDLIEKLEAADGPSRELDAEIGCKLHGNNYGLASALNSYAVMPEKDDRVETGHYWEVCSGASTLIKSLKYSSSIDAAMTLIPDGWDLFSVNLIQGDFEYDVAVSRGRGPYGCQHKSIPIAICIAALRARERK